MRLYDADPELESNGVQIDVGDDAFFVVKPTYRGNYSSYLQAKARPHRRQMENGTLPQDKSEELLNDAILKHVLVEVGGFERRDPDSDEIRKLTNSQEDLTWWLNQRMGSDTWREIVLEAAANEATFRKEVLEETAKN